MKNRPGIWSPIGILTAVAAFCYVGAVGEAEAQSMVGDEIKIYSFGRPQGSTHIVSETEVEYVAVHNNGIQEIVDVLATTINILSDFPSRPFLVLGVTDGDVVILEGIDDVLDPINSRIVDARIVSPAVSEGATATILRFSDPGGLNSGSVTIELTGTVLAGTPQWSVELTFSTLDPVEFSHTHRPGLILAQRTDGLKLPGVDDFAGRVPRPDDLDPADGKLDDGSIQVTRLDADSTASAWTAGIVLGSTSQDYDWAFTFQFYDADGVFSFTENFDDRARIRITPITSSVDLTPTGAARTHENREPARRTYSTFTFPGGGWFAAEIKLSQDRDAVGSPSGPAIGFLKTASTFNPADFGGIGYGAVFDTDTNGESWGSMVRLGVNPDSDHDGIPDYIEKRYPAALNQQNPDDASEDFDGDGLTGLEEIANGTRPDRADTDRDGLSDSVELSQGTNPNDRNDPPDPTDLLPTVWVEDPGNPGDPVDNTLRGDINYVFKIGRFEVTNEEYTEFLNAKASSNGDPFELFNTNMVIARQTGEAGETTTYSVMPGREHHPVNWVSVFDAMRFANWLNNGKGNGDTETGAYTLEGGSIVPSNADTVVRNTNATWFLPSISEWHKAAFFDGERGVYFNFVGTDTVPDYRTANFAGVNDGPLAVTDPRAASSSFYGAKGMGGNLSEWAEPGFAPGRFYYVPGGSWPNIFLPLSHGAISRTRSSAESANTGFRVARRPSQSVGSGFRITRVATDPDEFGRFRIALVWASQPGKSYRVLASNDLLVAIEQWAVVVPETPADSGDATSAEVLIDHESTSLQFFRVEEVSP